MTNDNVPTGPGWWYRISGNIVEVDTDGDGLFYRMVGYPNTVPVVDDGCWRGPVPMPGEWVSADEHYKMRQEMEDIDELRERLDSVLIDLENCRASQ